MNTVNSNGVSIRLASQSLLYSLGKFGTGLLALVTTPILTRYLSLEEYGILGLMGSVAGFMGYLFHLNASVLFGNDYVTAKSDAERRLVLSTMYFFGLVNSLVWGVLALTQSDLLSSAILNAAGYSVYVRVTVLTSMFVSMNVVVISFLQMSQRVLLYSYISFASAAANGLLMVIALIFFHVTLIQLMWIGVFVSSGTAIWYFWTIHTEIRPAFSFNHAWEIVRLGIPTIGHAMAHWVLTSLDLIFLQRFSTTTDVGLYSFAYKFGFLMHILAYGFAAAWGPHLTKTLARKSEPEEQSWLIVRPYKLALAVLSSLGLALTLFVPEAFYLLGPVEYSAAMPAVPWIILGHLFLILYYGIVNVPQFVKNHRYLPLTTGSAAICNALLNWWLIPRFGMIAAAMTTAVSYAFLFATTLILARLSMRVPIPNLLGLLTIAVQVIVFVVVTSFTDIRAFSLFSMFIRAAAILTSFGIAFFLMFPGTEGVYLVSSLCSTLRSQKQIQISALK